MQSKYCPDVWKSLYVEKTSSTEVSIGFCCQSTMSPLTDYNDLNKIQAHRRNNFEAHCNNCWKIENVAPAGVVTDNIEVFIAVAASVFVIVIEMFLR